MVDKKKPRSYKKLNKTVKIPLRIAIPTRLAKKIGIKVDKVYEPETIICYKCGHDIDIQKENYWLVKGQEYCVPCKEKMR